MSTELQTEVNSKYSNTIQRTPSQSSLRRAKHNFWPMIKNASSWKGADQSIQQPPASQSSSSPRGSEKSRVKQSPKDIPVIPRRKVSFPDLVLEPKTTVRECYMDSPTIPGRFPIHERSSSAPGSSLTRIPFKDPFFKTVAEPLILTPEDEHLATGKSFFDDDSQDVALNVPSGEMTSKKSNDLTTVSKKLMGKVEKPPAVPPKSPRLTVRIPPSPQLAKSKFSSPQQKDRLQKDRLLNNSNDISPMNEGSPTRPHITYQLQNPDVELKAASATEIRPKPSGFPENLTQRRKRSESALARVGPANTPFEVPKKLNVHKKGFSETSIMDRGLPATSPQSTKGSHSPVITMPTLPTGINPSDAYLVLSPADVERLQDQARGQARAFKVLSFKDVKALSQELRVLDERYQYLRNTHKTLRSGRHSLHERMINYLRSPGLSIFCRESMLKQEEALAELDLSIDEWVAKLEQVEIRRYDIRQKLLEHVAASLILQTMSRPQELQERTQTEPNMEMDFRESIRVYADSKVYADAEFCALLAEIEMEMQLVGGRRNNSSTLQDS